MNGAIPRGETENPLFRFRLLESGAEVPGTATRSLSLSTRGLSPLPSAFLAINPREANSPHLNAALLRRKNVAWNAWVSARVAFSALSHLTWIYAVRQRAELKGVQKPR